jgi:chromosome segregation ATPase
MADIGQALLDAIADLKADMGHRFATVDQRLDGMDRRFDEMEAVLVPMRAQLDGLPLINRAVTVIQQEVRSIKAAFNDFARTNPTVGEIEALHQDVNRVQAENAELAHKVATLERRVKELQERVIPVLVSH